MAGLARTARKSTTRSSLIGKIRALIENCARDDFRRDLLSGGRLMHPIGAAYERRDRDRPEADTVAVERAESGRKPLNDSPSRPHPAPDSPRRRACR